MIYTEVTQQEHKFMFHNFFLKQGEWEKFNNFKAWEVLQKYLYI